MRPTTSCPGRTSWRPSDRLVRKLRRDVVFNNQVHCLHDSRQFVFKDDELHRSVDEVDAKEMDPEQIVRNYEVWHIHENVQRVERLHIVMGESDDLAAVVTLYQAKELGELFLGRHGVFL